jgi:membrane protein DedA with SNARE-associated domain
MQWAKYISVLIASMLKFIGGPLSGVALGLHWVETFVCTVAGMMASVFIFTFLGQTLKYTLLRRFYKARRLFTPRNRRIVRIWRKYGMAGVAFLTPLILTPIGGTIVAASFGESKAKIFFYMLVSALFWGLIFTLIIDELGHKVLEWF